MSISTNTESPMVVAPVASNYKIETSSTTPLTSPISSLINVRAGLQKNHHDLSARIAKFVKKHPFDQDVIGSDVVLCVGDQRFFAHRFMLACSSEPFRAMLTGNMKEGHEREVQLKDIDPRVFEQILTYVYTGEVTLTNELSIPVIVAAEMFAIEGLLELCKNFILRFAQKILVLPIISLLTESLFVQLVQSDELQMREYQLFDAALRWAEARASDTQSLETVLKDVIKYIRFPLMTVSELYIKVQPLAGTVVPYEALTEALFCHLNWGITAEKTRPRTSIKKRKRVSFTQTVSFDEPENDE